MEPKIAQKLEIILLLTVACQAQEPSVAEINIVIVTEKDYPLPKTPIREALKYVEYDKGIEIKNSDDVEVEEGDTEKDVCEKIFTSPDRPPTILIDTTRRPRDMGSKISPVVKSVASKMGLPTISATYGLKTRITGWENLMPQQKDYLVPISPPGDIIPQAVRDICTAQSFKSAGIIYDKEIVMDLKYSTLLENIPTRHIIQVVDGSISDIKTKLQNMRPPDIANYFIIGSKKTIENALTAADELNLFGREFSWFFITKDTINELSCTCRNITGVLMSPVAMLPDRLQSILRRVGDNQVSQMDTAFYFDLAEMTVKVLKEMKEKGMYPGELTYPLCDDMALTEEQTAERDVKLLTAFRQFPFQGTFGEYRFEGSDKGNFQAIKLKMTRIQFAKSKQIKRDDDNIGTWEYQFSNGIITYDSGKNLKEFKAIRMYRVTTVIQPPFIYKTNISGETVFTGYCIDLLDAIKRLLDFDYTIFETADGKFGAMDENNQWNGMIRDIKERKAEIALGPISVMAERETVVDFTVPFYDLVGITILMKKTKIESSLFKFLTVLENKVWGCILAAYFFTSFLMFLFDRLSPYSFHNNREKYKDDDENRDFTMKECLWFCMTSLTPQGGGEAPRNLSGRLVAATWWLFGFIIIASYTANLAAFLTVSRLDSPIESLDDLAKQYKIKYAPQNDTSSMTYFKRMAHIEDKFYEIWKNMSLDDTLNETERAKLAVWDYPVSDKYTKIWWTMRESKMPPTFEEGVERVKNSTPVSGFAFIADSTQVKYALMTNCDLVSVGSEFSRKPLALAVQQGSTLKDEMSSAILQLLNDRVLEGLKETWWNNNPDRKECDDNDRQSDGISIANIGGVFIVIFIGIVLSCITLLIEYWYYKQKRSNNRVVAVKDYNNDPTRREKR